MAIKPGLKTLVSLCLALVVTAGCAANRFAVDESLSTGTYEIVVHSIVYDDKGLPIIGTALLERPSSSGDRFSVVRLNEGRPIISYDIAVVRQKPDFLNPLRAVYEWMGKGFVAGANVSGIVAEGTSHVTPQKNDEALAKMAVIVTPMAVGTVGGFVIGLADGIMQTALELGKIVGSGEEAVTCTTYEYDALNRLAFMHMHTPDRKEELVRTEFSYEGAETVPSVTVVKSLAEGKQREIR